MPQSSNLEAFEIEILPLIWSAQRADELQLISQPSEEILPVGNNLTPTPFDTPVPGIAKSWVGLKQKLFVINSRFCDTRAVKGGSCKMKIMEIVKRHLTSTFQQMCNHLREILFVYKRGKKLLDSQKSWPGFWIPSLCPRRGWLLSLSWST